MLWARPWNFSQQDRSRLLMTWWVAAHLALSLGSGLMIPLWLSALLPVLWSAGALWRSTRCSAMFAGAIMVIWQAMGGVLILVGPSRHPCDVLNALVTRLRARLIPIQPVMARSCDWPQSLCSMLVILGKLSRKLVRVP